MRPTPLPMVPDACSLSGPDAEAQIGRYRSIGAAARVLHSEPRLLEVTVGTDIPDVMIEQLLATERACCPFFSLVWVSTERRLSIGVAESADEPALALIAAVLGVA